MITRRSGGERRDVPAWSIAFRAPDTAHTFQARVRSATEGMWFEGSFEAVVSWNGLGNAARSRALARIQREIIRVATSVSENFPLGDRGTAEAEIACAIAEARGLREESVREVGVTVSLTVDEEDLALDRERERVGPRNEIDKAVHRVRMERVGELQRDVLGDPQVARVWWYEQNPDLLHEIAKAGEALDMLITPPVDEAEEATAGVTGSEGGGDPVLDAFLKGLEPWEVPGALNRLTTMFEGLERRDLADRLRERWPSN